MRDTGGQNNSIFGLVVYGLHISSHGRVGRRSFQDNPSNYLTRFSPGSQRSRGDSTKKLIPVARLLRQGLGANAPGNDDLETSTSSILLKTSAASVGAPITTKSPSTIHRIKPILTRTSKSHSIFCDYNQSLESCKNFSSTTSSSTLHDPASWAGSGLILNPLPPHPLPRQSRHLHLVQCRITRRQMQFLL